MEKLTFFWIVTFLFFFILSSLSYSSLPNANQDQCIRRPINYGYKNIFNAKRKIYRVCRVIATAGIRPEPKTQLHVGLDP